MNRMRISELAARSGVPASTLRYYEAEGLLPAERADNGYRVYGQPAVDRLAFITQAKHLDLPLTAVRDLVTAWESEPCHSVRATYRPLLTERARQVEERQAALGDLREKLARAIQELDALPDRDESCDSTCAALDQPAQAAPVDDTPPVACALGSGDYARRRHDWRDLLAGARLTDVDGGVRATLPTAELERATSLAAAEQACCAFYAIHIDLQGPSFALTITAPPEAAPLLADLLPATETR